MGTLRTAARIMTGRVTPPATQQRAIEYLGTSSLGAFGLGTSLTGGSLELSGAERDWSASAVAYRCVDYIASNLASVDMLALVGDEPDESDPVARLWNTGTPGAAYSARIVKAVLIARAELTGEAFALIDRGDTATGPARGLHPIYDPVEVVTGPADNGRGIVETVTGFIVRKGGQRVPLLPSEVLWLRYPHPTDRWGALAPWKAALYAHETDVHARAWQRGEFRNGARPSAVINLGNVTPEMHAQSVAAFNSKIAGAGNASKALIVSGTTPSSVDHLSLTPAEMSYLETRVSSADEVMLAFGLRRDLFMGQSTYENQRAAKTAAWSETLVPKLDVLAGEIDRQLMPDTSRTAGWDLSPVEALRESEDAIFDRVQKATLPDVLMLDEARAMLGYDPLPNGAGQFTLTAYRERVRLAAQVEYLPQLTGAVSPRTAPRLIRHRGVTKLVAARRAQLEQRSAAQVRTAYSRHERIGARAIERLAERQVKDVLRKLRELTRAGTLDDTLHRWAAYAATMPQTMPLPGAPGEQRMTHDVGQRMAADDLLAVPFWTEETRKALEDFMTGAWLDGGERAAVGFGLSFDVFDQHVLDEMGDRLRVLSGQITETTRAALDAQLLHAGVEAGESIDDLAERLRSVFTDMSTWRAELIARTETVGGFNAAAHRVAADSGLVVERTWLATSDGRTRPSHERQNGHRLTGTAGLYPNGCAYPGDPSAPASETVACRCVELFETG